MHSPLLTKPVFTQSKVEPKRQASRQPRFTFWAGLALMVIILAVAVLHARGVFVQAPSRTIAPPPPQVAVSAPLQRDVDGRLEFLGQFSAVDHLELRAQVGGALTQIGFKDGDIVHKGDLLFVIDPANRRSIPLGQLMDAYGLTRAEARVALAASLAPP